MKQNALVSSLRNFFLLHELLSKSLISVLIKVFGALLSLLVSIQVSRQIGAEQSGYYFLSFSILTLLSSVGSLGLNNTVLRLIASAHYRSDWKCISQIFGKSIVLAFLASSIVSLIVYAGSEEISSLLFSKELLSPSLEFFSLALPLFVLFILVSHALQAISAVFRSMMLVGPVQYLLLFFLLISWGVSDSKTASYMFMLSCLGTLFIAMVFWFLNDGSGIAFGFSSSSLMKLSFPMLVAQLISQLNAQAGNVFLGLWSKPEDVAFFAVSMKLAMLTSFILLAVNRVVAPKFAQYYDMDDLKSLKILVGWSTRLMIVCALPPLLIILCFPEWILSWFGEEFEEAGSILIILAAGQFVNVATGSVGFLLQMTGHERVYKNNLILSFVISLFLGVTLIPWLGAIGAALMTFFALSAANILSWYSVVKHLGINTLSATLCIRSNSVGEKL